MRISRNVPVEADVITVIRLARVVGKLGIEPRYSNLRCLSRQWISRSRGRHHSFRFGIEPIFPRLKRTCDHYTRASITDLPSNWSRGLELALAVHLALLHRRANTPLTSPFRETIGFSRDAFDIELPRHCVKCMLHYPSQWCIHFTNWCYWLDSNQHVFRHKTLDLTRLPITPQ